MSNDLSNTLIKLGPLGGFLAAVGYCVWPYLSPARPPQPQPAPLPRIEASSLNPHFEPASHRDPFRGPGAPAPTPTIAGAKPTGTPTSRANGTAGRPAARPSARSPEPTPEFRLGATMVSGPRQAAIIDGRVYRQGETVESALGSWTVDWVEPGRVLLAHPRRRDPVALEMPDPMTLLASDDGPDGAPGPPDLLGRAMELGRALDLSAAQRALAAAGVSMPVPDLLQQLARRSDGSIAGAYRSLLGLLISPPRPPSTTTGAPAPAASGEQQR